MTTRSKLKPQIAGYSHLEPLPDPPREPDMQQDRHIVASHSALEIYFKRRDDALIAGGGYLRRDATNDAERLAPDCVVAFGVNPKGIVARNGYVISEVGKPPDFVLEIASRSTGRRDYTVKREGYAGYEVREYWRFDHTGGRYHDAPLAGDKLVGGEYERLEIHEGSDGLLWGHSAVLGLDICWDDGELRFRNPGSGEFLPMPVELDDARETAEARAEVAEARTEAAEARTEAAEAHADAERAGRLAAEYEAARLREQLRRLRQS